MARPTGRPPPGWTRTGHPPPMACPTVRPPPGWARTGTPLPLRSRRGPEGASPAPPAQHTHTQGDPRYLGSPRSGDTPENLT